MYKLIDILGFLQKKQKISSFDIIGFWVSYKTSLKKFN